MHKQIIAVNFLWICLCVPAGVALKCYNCNGNAECAKPDLPVTTCEEGDFCTIYVASGRETRGCSRDVTTIGPGLGRSSINCDTDLCNGSYSGFQFPTLHNIPYPYPNNWKQPEEDSEEKQPEKDSEEDDYEYDEDGCSRRPIPRVLLYAALFTVVNVYL